MSEAQVLQLHLSEKAEECQESTSDHCYTAEHASITGSEWNHYDIIILLLYAVVLQNCDRVKDARQSVHTEKRH